MIGLNYSYYEIHWNENKLKIVDGAYNEAIDYTNWRLFFFF